MKRVTQIGFLAVFLGIVYTVPLVQTAYEYRANPGHRIQMLDLPRDIFVTPLEKKRAARAALDSIAQAIEEIGRELKALPADTGAVASPLSARERCEAAAITVTVLEKNVMDYNRHVSGAANAFAAQDTLQPYYRALVGINALFGELSTHLQQEPLDVAGCTDLVARLRSNVVSARSMASSGNYLTLTLTALRRIMVGANYLRPYESEMEKSSVFATALRPWMIFGYLRAFGDFGTKGVKGAGEWLFYRPDVEYLVRPGVFDPASKSVDVNDVAINEDIVGTIVDFKEQLASRGIDLLFVAMPAKPSIYPDLLNRRVSPASSGQLSHTVEALKRLRQAGVETVDLFPVLAGERARDSLCGDSIYLSTDTHFKGRGVLAAARAIAERVKQYHWYTPGTVEYAVDTVTIPRFGDIAEMIGVPASVVAKRKPPFAAETVACYQVRQVKRREDGTVLKTTLYKDDLRHANILVLGDSYSRIFQTDAPKSAGWISHLARELSQPMASIVSDGGSSTLVRQTLARKPNLLKNKKLVIWEVVERDFRYGEEGWKKIAMIQH